MHSKISDTTATKVNCAQLDVSLGLPPHIKDIFVGNGAVHLALVSTMISQPNWTNMIIDQQWWLFSSQVVEETFLKSRAKRKVKERGGRWWKYSRHTKWMPLIVSFIQLGKKNYWILTKKKKFCSKFWGFLMHLIDGNLIWKFKSLFFFLSMIVNEPSQNNH